MCANPEKTEVREFVIQGVSVYLETDLLPADQGVIDVAPIGILRMNMGYITFLNNTKGNALGS